MRERRCAELFNSKLERLTMTIENKDESELPACAEEEEVREEVAPLLELAETIIGTDFSGESRIQNSLLQRLLQKFPVQRPDLKDEQLHLDSELSDDELELAAGGAAGRSEKETGCSLCGCRRAASTLESENCISCGHPRSNHK